MSEEEKMVLYNVLQDIANELREIHKEERRKIREASRKIDKQGRIVLELKGDEVIEHIYYEDLTTLPSVKSQVYQCESDDRTGNDCLTIYDVASEEVQQARPDLVEWAATVREKIKKIEGKGSNGCNNGIILLFLMPMSEVARMRETHWYYVLTKVLSGNLYRVVWRRWGKMAGS